MIRCTKNGWLLILGLISMTPILYLMYHGLYTKKIHFYKDTYLGNVASNSPVNCNASSQHLTTEKANACFVVLMRNADIHDFRRTMQQLEDRFNNKFHYPYVFLNDKPFTKTVKRFIKAQTKAKVEFGLIPKQHWSIPDFLDKEEVMRNMEREKKLNVPNQGKLSYHHMCRFESGFFAQHSLLKKYEYYWRVEPSVEFMCDIIDDPFIYMKNHNKKYGFTMVMPEYKETIPTLYTTMKKWIQENHINLPENNLQKWVLDDNDNYNGLHFWSNFEIGSLEMLRSEQYLSYFNYLDQSGGFFFERWGDAPVHSLYVALMLNKSDIHFFKDIGYKHDIYGNCPVDLRTNLKLKCYCNPKESNNLDAPEVIQVLELIGDPAADLLRVEW